MKTSPPKIEVKRYRDDGIIPNSRLPIVLYKGAIDIQNPLKIEDKLRRHVEERGWRLEWTWRIYKFTHWHSTAHECLVCISGSAIVRLGGPRIGGEHKLTPGSALMIPAGVAHRNIGATQSFQVCGIYPKGQMWDLIKGEKTFDAEARTRAAKVPRPKSDPIYGKDGPLMSMWS